MENTELITVVQLPIIAEQLKPISEQIAASVDYALSLECNEATYKEIKKIRADLNKSYQTLETQRKAVKREVLAPWNMFEDTYKEYVTNVFKPKERELAARISTVENGLKAEKENEVIAYFGEYAESKGIDFLSFPRDRIPVTMNASKKSLHEKAKSFIDCVADDLALIETQEHKEEILVEYKQTLNAAQAILTVTNRHKAIEEERKRKEEERAFRAQQAVAAAKVEEAIEEETLSAPTETEAEPVEEVSEPETPQKVQRTLYKVAFAVETYNLEDIKALKNLFEERGMNYEQL